MDVGPAIAMSVAGASVTTEAEVERAMQENAASDLRITPTMLDEEIARAEYLRPEGSAEHPSTMTLCVLTLRSGFSVVGQSAALDPANFDEEIGRNVAFTNARNKLWPLLGYAAKVKHHLDGGVMSDPINT